MKKIKIAYFHSAKLPGLPYTHLEEHDFSKEKRNEIIDTIMDAGYNVLLQKTNPGEVPTLIIWIDKYRFQQR